MGEVQNVFSVFAAVDEAVVERAERASAVATVLRPYEDPGTPGWFAAVTEWAAETESDTVLAVDLDVALAEMTSDDELDGWARARRLLALAALARAYPDTYGEPGSDERGSMAAAALRPLTPDPTREGPSPEEDPASQLLLLLGNKGRHEGRFVDLDDWPAMLAYADGAGLVDPTTARLTTPPCTGTALIDESTGRPVLSLTTYFTPRGVTIDQIGRYLDPAAWPTCARLWCSMKRLEPPQPRRHLEVIALDCRGVAAGDPTAWRLTTCLELSTRTSAAGDRRSVGYRIARDRSGDDGRVEVDSGCISAHQVGGVLSIRTTKRLRFTGHDFGMMTAMFMCALGWASVGEHMVYTCAAAGAPGSDAPPDTTYHPTGSSAKGPGTGDASPVDAVAAAVASCVHQTASTIETALDEARSGTYTPASLLRDGTAMWVHSITAAAEVAVAANRLATGRCFPAPPAKSPAGHRRTIESAGFTVPAGAGDRRLALAAHLVNDFGDEIAVDAVEIRPAVVGPGRPSFRLVVEVAAEQSGAYWGDVLVTGDGLPDASVAVEVIVP